MDEWEVTSEYADNPTEFKIALQEVFIDQFRLLGPGYTWEDISNFLTGIGQHHRR